MGNGVYLLKLMEVESESCSATSGENDAMRDRDETGQVEVVRHGADM